MDKIARAIKELKGTPLEGVEGAAQILVDWSCECVGGSRIYLVVPLRLLPNQPEGEATLTRHTGRLVKTCCPAAATVYGYVKVKGEHTVGFLVYSR